jgi:hypothetical protein
MTGDILCTVLVTSRGGAQNTPPQTAQVDAVTYLLKLT